MKLKPALITTAIALLAAPSGAPAATTYTVGPGQTIAAALAKAGDGDTIHVLPCLYAEQPLTVAHAVRIEGEAGTIVTNASTDASKPLFTITSDGAALATLTAASTAGTVVAGNTGGVAITDALIVQAAGAKPAVSLSGAGASSVVRSSVAAADPAADAVDLQSTTTGDRSLSIDSSILSGGANAASLHVTSATSPTALTNGNIVIDAVHATLAGAATAVATTVTAFPLTTPGSITAGIDRSIVRGTVAGGVTVTNSDATNAAVFVNAAAKNFHLRADAASAIDQGGPAVSGESDRDIDGQPRVAGAASDLGADEFVNQAPAARLAAPAAVRTPNATTFDASASSDPEAAIGGGIAGYHFDFGDGTSLDSPTPVVTHAYPKPGSYSATVTVTDAQGRAGAPSAPVQAAVADGIAPTARIISPRNNRTLRLLTKRHKRAPIRFTGSASDDTSVAAVGLTLRRLGTKRITRIKVTVRQGIWSYKVPKKLKLRRGRYELKAYAVDAAGNVSKAAHVRFRLK
jgi:PKD repeat protein